MAESDAALLNKRFTKLRRSLEAEGPDASVPGASRDGSWAVLTAGRHGRFLTRCEREQAECVAAANVREGWEPVAMFDLGTLEGQPPPPGEGDLVRYEDNHYEGREWWVVDTTLDIADGQMFTRVCLSNDRDASRFDELPPGSPTKLIDDVDEAEIEEIIKRAEPDERLPVRYDVAATQVLVVFNTVAVAA